MTDRRVQVVIDGESIFDVECAPHDVCFVVRDGRISLIAGPGGFGFLWGQRAANRVVGDD